MEADDPTGEARVTIVMALILGPGPALISLPSTGSRRSRSSQGQTNGSAGSTSPTFPRSLISLMVPLRIGRSLVHRGGGGHFRKPRPFYPFISGQVWEYRMFDGAGFPLDAGGRGD